MYKFVQTLIMSYKSAIVSAKLCIVNEEKEHIKYDEMKK